MGWRDILKTKPYEQKEQKEQKVKKDGPKQTFATISLTSQKVKKMTACLDGFYCKHLILKGDRQVCKKNGRPIFDMSRCPLDLWETH